LVKDGAQRRRSAVAILDQGLISESRSAKRTMARCRSNVQPIGGLMAGSEPQANGDPRIGPRGKRIFQRSLLAMVAVIPALSALYGLHRHGGEGAGVGLVSAIFVTAMLMFPAIKLMNWLSAPAKPPLWPHERLYWSATALVAAAIFVGVAVLIGAFDPIEEHGLDGVIDGFIAGFLSAALFAFVAARLHAWLMWLMEPHLTPAEASIRQRAAWTTPLGAAILLTGWAFFARLTHEVDLLLPVAAVLIGAALGHIVASRPLAAEGERLYNARRTSPAARSDEEQAEEDPVGEDQ